MPENPFQSPPMVDDSDEIVGVTDAVPSISGKLIGTTGLRWQVICFVAAVPSFTLGLMVTQGRANGIAAMCVGIFLFAIGYAVLDLFAIRHWLHRSPILRRATKIGIGFRLFASVVVPIGVFLDMYPGLLAVGLLGVFNAIDGGTEEALSFALIVVMTLVQGIFLNILLTAFIAFVFAVLKVSGKPKSSS